MMSTPKKFGVGGNVGYNFGGKGQINKQHTRGGSIYGSQKDIPDITALSHVGKKEGGTVKKFNPFMGKESAKEEKAEKKVSPATYKKGEKAEGEMMKCGGKVKKMAAGGFVKADGIAQRGKTKGRII